MQETYQQIDGPAVTKPRFSLKRVRREDEERQWNLPDELAAFYNEYATLHVPDSDMRKEMEEYPAPSNLVQVQRLDQWAIDELKKSGKNALIDANKDFMAIRGVSGPLGAMLQSLEMHRNGENPEELDSDTFSDQLQNSIILLAHAFQKVTWFRRVRESERLPTQNPAENQKIAKILERSGDELFSQSFDEEVKVTCSTGKHVIEVLKPKKEGVKKNDSSKPTGQKRKLFKRNFGGASSSSPFPDGPSPRGGGNWNNRSNQNYNQTTRLWASCGPVFACCETGPVIPNDTNPIQNSSINPNEQGGGESHGSGSGEHADQRGNPRSDSKNGSVSQQRVCQTERGRTISTEERGLDGEARPKGRLLFGPGEHVVSETDPFSLERDSVRIPLPGLRSGTNPENFHKTDESSGVCSEEIGNSSGDMIYLDDILPMVSTPEGIVLFTCV